MATDSDWLLTAAQFAGVSLTAAVYVAGLVVSLRRWHVGPAARLAAAGFGLLLASVGFQVLLWFTSSVIGIGDGSPPFLRIAAVLSFGTLLNVTGWTLIVLGLRSALRAAARADDAPQQAGAP